MVRRLLGRRDRRRGGDDQIELDAGALRKLGGADGGARGAAGGPEEFDQQVGGRVGHIAVPREGGVAVHEDLQLEDALDAVQRAERLPQHGHGAQRAQARTLARLLQADAAADAAGHRDAAVHARQLSA
ncbi:hypothetical protein BFJ72_g14655 [Fusarium proliferatum]|uniref:Uncharacterized protein n=1 Tax=Gibberella intermedia TaxID=948311 RepID=A0A420S0E7_GIBIN|nr:hypothetical protein BFJ72_g14655 [Fusarium proliferatum]